MFYNIDYSMCFRSAIQRRRTWILVMAALAAVVAALLAFGVSERPASAQSEPQTVGKVTNLTATAAGQPNGTVRLTWNAADNAQVYLVIFVKHDDAAAGNYANGQMRVFTATQGTISGLDGGAKYYFVARGMRFNWIDFGEVLGDWSAVQSATAPGISGEPSSTSPQSEPQTVGKVTGLIAAGQPDGAVRLTWNVAANAQVYLVIFVKHDDAAAGNYANGQMRVFTATQGTISGLDGGAKYYFVARGMRFNWIDFGEVLGDWSTVQSATPSGKAALPTIPFSDLQNSAWLEQNKPALANQLKALPWIADGVDESEREAAELLIATATWHPDMFDSLLQKPWVLDSITEHETTAIWGIRWSARKSTALVERMLAKPWVQDGITRDEAAVVYSMYWTIRAEDESLQQEVIQKVIEILDMPFLDSVESPDAMAVRELELFEGEAGSAEFLKIMAHPTLSDGITDEEAKIVTLIYRINKYMPEYVDILLDGDSVFLEERAIELPLTGQTLLTIIRLRDVKTQSMDVLEHAVRVNEEYMGEPYYTNWIALLFIKDPRERGAEAHHYSHFTFSLNKDDKPLERAFYYAHEVAHYYWRGNQNWINEGTANFLGFVGEHKRIGTAIHYDSRPRLLCPYATTIAQLEALNTERQTEQFRCNYRLGEQLFVDLYETLGEKTFQQGFRRLYLKTLHDAPTDDCEGTRLGICHVASAFKDGASAQVIAKVDKVIDRWYYGKEPASPAALAERINALPWLADGVTEDERRAVNALRDILQEAPALVETLLSFPWLADAITRDESYAILHFGGLLRGNPTMAETVLRSPWFSAGVTRTDEQIIWGIRYLYDLDRSNISALTAKPWFKDGLSSEELMLVGDLGDIAYRSEADFLAIIDMPFLETFEPADALAVSSLRQLTWCDDGQYDFSMECSDNETGDERVSKKFRRAMAHPAISDGIDDEEAKIVATLFSARLFNPDIFDRLLNPGTVTMMEEKTINLPHTGETQLTIIRIRRGAERTMRLLERAVRTVEGLMATPLPVGHVIFLAEDNHHGAGNFLTNMTGQHEIFDTDESSELRALHVLAHETAHYYWYYDWNRHWVAEGLATFFQSLQRRQANAGPGGEPVVPIWPPHLPPCPISHGNIAELERLEDAGVITYCSDSLGERLFQDLWRNLGDSVFRQGLANLYVTARSGAPVGRCGFATAGMCKVEAAFKAAAPAEAAATVDQVLDRWYYNSEPYDNSHVDTSPANPRLPGGVEITRAYISLDKDRPEETRTDRFSASEIQDKVLLTLHYSLPTGWQTQKLPLTFVTYFEDGFAYRNNDTTYTFYAGRSQASLSFRVGDWPGRTWIVQASMGKMEPPPMWAPGRYWVSVYHEGLKVAEVEFEVTP